MIAASSTMPDFTGRVIGGEHNDQYRLVKLLGSGTYGVVYKALDMYASGPLSPVYRAVKVIRKAGRSSREIATIHREINLHLAVSSHPNVVTLVDHFEKHYFVYIVLEYCSGGDLFEQIVDRRTYMGNDELVKAAFVSLIDAVQACHDANIAHRDLKPENILTSKDGSEVFLADFGLATEKPTVKRFGCGTSIYMSPECYGEHGIKGMLEYARYSTHASDVWALGVILINMLSAQRPWDMPTVRDPGFASFVANPNFPLYGLPISQSIKTIIRRALTLDPTKRITLPELRSAILAVDTIFLSNDKLAHRSALAHPKKHNKKNVKCPVVKGESAASEIDIHRAPGPHAAAGVGRVDFSTRCLADSFSTTTTTFSTGCSDGPSCASSGDSSADSSLVVTPAGSTPVLGHGEFEKELEEIDWQKGSIAQLLIRRHQMNQSQFVV